ncbi:hypothetical protein E2320_001416 [Naja naja]|nr:hypothetical protein E2320_001416 [Naja naja]
MTSNPAFPPFRPTAETWESYINRFKCFLDAINLADISDHRKKSYFLQFAEPQYLTLLQHCWPLVLPGIMLLGDGPRLRERLLVVIWQLYEQLSCTRLSGGHVIKSTTLWGQELKVTKVPTGLQWRSPKLQSCQHSQQQKFGKSSQPESSAIHYNEASTEEGCTSDINHLRQPKTSQKGNRSDPNQPPRSQPICLSCGGNHFRASCKGKDIYPGSVRQERLLPSHSNPRQHSISKNKLNTVPLANKLSRQTKDGSRHWLSTLHHLMEHLEITTDLNGKEEASRLQLNPT